MENSKTMNQQILESFVKRAQDAGLTREQAVKYANDYLLASAPQKTASTKTLGNYVDEVLNATGVEKTAQSTAYVQGILKEAVDKGYDIDSSVKVAAVVVKNNNAFKKAAPVQKQAASTEQLSQEKLTFYAEGFLKAATDAGFTPGQGYDLLNHVIKSAAPKQPAKVEKKANDDMIAQLMQMLQGNPEMAQQLLGGAGGGAGGPPPPPGPGGLGGGLAGLMGGAGAGGPPPGGGMGAPGGAPGMGGDMFKSLPQ